MDLINVSIAKKFMRMLAGQGRTSQTVFGNFEAIGVLGTDMSEHKVNTMPHEFVDLKNNKKYRFGFQVSEDGNPQTIYEEIVE